MSDADFGLLCTEASLHAWRAKKAAERGENADVWRARRDGVIVQLARAIQGEQGRGA